MYRNAAKDSWKKEKYSWKPLKMGNFEGERETLVHKIAVWCWLFEGPICTFLCKITGFITMFPLSFADRFDYIPFHTPRGLYAVTASSLRNFFDNFFRPDVNFSGFHMWSQGLKAPQFCNPAITTLWHLSLHHPNSFSSLSNNKPKENSAHTP